MNYKNISFFIIALILLLHFWIRFKISEPYPGLVLPGFYYNGGNENFYKKSKINFTFYNTDHDSLTILPKMVFPGLHPRFSNHYTIFIWNRKMNGSGLSNKDEKKLNNYLFQRGAKLWDSKKTIDRIVIRKDQYTYKKEDPTIFFKKETIEEWIINQNDEKK